MISELVAYLALCVACAWALRAPVVGLGVYYFLAFARPQDVFWYSLGSSRLSLIIGLVVCGTWIYACLRRTHPWPERSPLNGLLFVFLALKIMSAFFAADQDAAWTHVDRVWRMILFYYVTVSLVDTRARIRWIVCVIAVSLVYLGLWGNWQWYVSGAPGGLGGELAGPGWEVNATLADRNVFGYMLAIGIPFAFFVFLTERAAWLRWPMLGALPFLVNAVMLTFGRAAFIAMVVAAAWCVLRLRRPALIAVCGIGGALLMYQLAGPSVIARILTVEEYDKDQSATGRLEAWQAGFAMMQDHPLLGVGPDHFGRYSAIYNPRVPQGLVAHNDFIQTAAETGIASGVILIAIFTLAFYNLRRVRKVSSRLRDAQWAYHYASMLEGSLICYLISAMFVSLPYFELFYLLVALTCCLRRVVERQARQTTRAPAGSRPSVIRPGAQILDATAG